MKYTTDQISIATDVAQLYGYNPTTEEAEYYLDWYFEFYNKYDFSPTERQIEIAWEIIKKYGVI